MFFVATIANSKYKNIIIISDLVKKYFTTCIVTITKYHVTISNGNNMEIIIEMDTFDDYNFDDVIMSFELDTHEILEITDKFNFIDDVIFAINNQKKMFIMQKNLCQSINSVNWNICDSNIINSCDYFLNMYTANLPSICQVINIRSDIKYFNLEFVGNSVEFTACCMDNAIKCPYKISDLQLISAVIENSHQISICKKNTTIILLHNDFFDFIYHISTINTE